MFHLCGVVGVSPHSDVFVMMSEDRRTKNMVWMQMSQNKMFDGFVGGGMNGLQQLFSQCHGVT